jgi:hypothetical protein
MIFNAWRSKQLTAPSALTKIDSYRFRAPMKPVHCFVGSIKKGHHPPIPSLAPSRPTCVKELIDSGSNRHLAPRLRAACAPGVDFLGTCRQLLWVCRDRRIRPEHGGARAWLH